MLTVGGNLSSNITKGCDWETKGVAIIDLSTKTWGSVFNAYAPAYEVTQEIVDKIGGSGRGGSTLKAPTDGFTDPSVQVLFARPKATTSPTTSSTASPSAPASGKKSKGGAIAGGILGVLALIGILCGAALFFLHRKKKQQQQQLAEQMGAMEAGGGMGATGPYSSPDQQKAELAASGLPAYSASELPSLAAPVQYHELAGHEKGAELPGDSVVTELALTEPSATPRSEERLTHTPPPV
jgi:hypothetical protein